MTVEDASPPVVATAGADPGGVHKTELEGLPAHTRHGGYQTAQQLLPLALLVQIFRVHGLGRGRGVDGLQRAQERVQTPLLSLAPLLRRTPGQLHVGTVLLHKNPSFRRPARHKSDQTALGAKWAWPSGDPAGGMLHPAGNAHCRSACMAQPHSGTAPPSKAHTRSRFSEIARRLPREQTVYPFVVQALL